MHAQEKDEMKNLQIKCRDIKQRQNVIHILESNGFKQIAFDSKSLVVRTGDTVYAVSSNLPVSLSCMQFMRKYAQNAPECVLVECGSFGMLDDENAEIRNPVRTQGVFANLIWNALGGIAMGIVIFFILFGWVW